MPQWQRDRFVKPRVAVKIVDQGDTFTINTPYNAEYVNKFKELVPEENRRWVPKKYWIVGKQWLPQVKALADKYFIELSGLPERLKKYKSKEFETHILYKIPKDDVESNSEISAMITRMKTNPSTEEYKLEEGYGWNEEIILLPKEGYFFPPSFDSSPRGTFLTQYQQHNNIQGVPLKIKKLRMSKTFQIILNNRLEDVLNLTDDEILALNKALQFRTKNIMFDFEAQDTLEEIIREADLKDPIGTAKLIKATFMFI